VTFGSFNNLAKVNDPLLVSWAEILSRVPDSRLLIKDMCLSFEAPRQRILEVFRQNGICSDRIVFAGLIKSRFEHLQRFNAVDISLDSFPYNGTTTSCESLIMGVPVVTRAGEDHRSRVTASQLKAVGLDSLIAYDKNEFIELSAALALDHERLQLLRTGLRERMQASPLMDARSFTRELETVYQRVWAHCCGW
jgi:predicted O-linked N-acetylglucosamine transferase (SPINDLY family)